MIRRVSKDHSDTTPYDIRLEYDYELYITSHHLHDCTFTTVYKYLAIMHAILYPIIYALRSPLAAFFCFAALAAAASALVVSLSQIEQWE